MMLEREATKVPTGRFIRGEKPGGGGGGVCEKVAFNV